MQNDFVTGSLKAPNALGIVRPVIEEIRKRKAEDVIFTKDTHSNDYLNTSEGKHLPVPHCIKNTAGWELYPEIQKEVRDSLVIEKPTFGSLILIDYLKKRIKSEEDTITFVGLCTDICVIANAVLAKTYFRENKVCVIKNAVAGVTEMKNEEALDVMSSLQIEII